MDWPAWLPAPLVYSTRALMYTDGPVHSTSIHPPTYIVYTTLLAARRVSLKGCVRRDPKRWRVDRPDTNQLGQRSLLHHTMSSSINNLTYVHLCLIETTSSCFSCPHHHSSWPFCIIMMSLQPPSARQILSRLYFLNNIFSQMLSWRDRLGKALNVFFSWLYHDTSERTTI